MYSYNLIKFVYHDRRSNRQLKTFCKKVRQVQKESGSREAEIFFREAVGLRTLEIYNEGYYRDAVNYEIALLHTFMRQPEKAADTMASSGILPGEGSELIFSEHQHRALAIYTKQTKAAQRGMEAVLLTSLPKSGSASMSQTIAKLMDAPIARFSLGFYPDYFLVPTWLQRAHSGGIVTHEHFPANHYNIKVLQQQKINRLFVQVRDPRAATLALLKMQYKFGVKEYLNLKFDDLYHENYLPNVQWLAGWQKAAHKMRNMKVQWIHFQDFRANPQETIARIFESFTENGYMYKLGEQSRQMQEIVSANFNKGDDNAWREHASDAMRRKMWRALPKSVIDMLQLES